MPWPHRLIAHNVNWGKNFSQTHDLMALWDMKLKEIHCLLSRRLVFWARVDCLKPILDLGLRWDDFERYYQVMGDLLTLWNVA